MNAELPQKDKERLRKKPKKPIWNLTLLRGSSPSVLYWTVGKCLPLFGGSPEWSLIIRHQTSPVGKVKPFVQHSYKRCCCFCITYRTKRLLRPKRVSIALYPSNYGSQLWKGENSGSHKPQELFMYFSLKCIESTYHCRLNGLSFQSKRRLHQLILSIETQENSSAMQMLAN